MINKFQKSIFLFLLLTFYFITSVPQAHAALSRPPNNLGLVGYWSLDDCRASHATDSSGQGNTGTLTNFALTGSTSNWTTSGKRGCALSFDGTNDYITIPDSDSLDLMDAFTISVWVNPAQTHQGMILKKYPGASGGSGWALFNNNNSLTFYDGVSFPSTGVTLSNSAWQLITFTRSVAGGNITPYLNGAPLSSFATNGSMTASTAPLFFGTENGGYMFAGKMDDVRIYNRALSATEVTALYGSGAAKILGAGSDAAAGLVAHWRLDESSGASATDALGGNTGTLTNFALTGETSNWVTGRLKGGLNFDGTDDKVDFGASNTLNVNTALTIGFWFKKVGNAGGAAAYHALVQRLGAGQTGYQVYIPNSDNIFSFWTNSIANSTYTVSDSNWHYYTVTNDGATTRFYVDGVAYGTASQTLTSVTSPTANTIGTYLTSGATNGSLDDVRIYNRALTATEVNNLYVSGTSRPTKINASTAGRGITSGLVGHWTFDGQYLSTTTATDSSGQGNNGTLTGANGKPRPVLGRLGQALQFDGVDDVVDAGSGSSLNIAGDITISTWVKTTDGSDAHIVGGYEATGPYPGYGLGIGVGGGNVGKITYYDGNGAVWRVAGAATAVNDNQWHHIVVSVSGATATYYKDGASEGTSVATAPTSYSGAHVIGSRSDNTTQYNFPGYLDDVRIYDRALSASEVLQLYNLR